jgi:hypothetical protein
LKNRISRLIIVTSRVVPHILCQMLGDAPVRAARDHCFLCLCQHDRRVPDRQSPGTAIRRPPDSSQPVWAGAKNERELRGDLIN